MRLPDVLRSGCAFTANTRRVPPSAQAMEARRREKERPWVQLLAAASVACAVLLAAVLYRLQHMP